MNFMISNLLCAKYKDSNDNIQQCVNKNTKDIETIKEEHNQRKDKVNFIEERIERCEIYSGREHFILYGEAKTDNESRDSCHRLVINILKQIKG